MIEVKNLVKDYGGYLAVDHLNFTIEDGQIYGFLGPNGAGKSTTMNIMTGYLSATEGEVFINGHDILEDTEEAKRCIGYLPELPPLYLDMTVYEYLRFAAELKKLPRSIRGESIDEVIALTGLDEAAPRLIRNLSKGYRQRVGLAQAVLGLPPVIILDEPTVGLDPKQMIEMRELIRNLGKKHTVILSSHILSEVSAVCDRIMIISRGKLIASDTPENLERQMTGTKGMELLVKGTSEAILDTLSGIGQVRDLQIRDTAEQGVREVLFQLEERIPLTCSEEELEHHLDQETEDIREKIFYRFARTHCPIFSMRQTKASLEDVFLELTMDEQPEITGEETLEQLETDQISFDGDIANIGQEAEEDDGDL